MSDDLPTLIRPTMATLKARSASSAGRTAGKAAAMAACYGSVSVVTFLTACESLNQAGTPFGGHMVAAMALMEAVWAPAVARRSAR